MNPYQHRPNTALVREWHAAALRGTGGPTSPGQSYWFHPTAVLLGAWGRLRRGEILGLLHDDIDPSTAASPFAGPGPSCCRPATGSTPLGLHDSL